MKILIKILGAFVSTMTIKYSKKAVTIIIYFALLVIDINAIIIFGNSTKFLH